jgi:excisionase family DNA binding protein
MFYKWLISFENRRGATFISSRVSQSLSRGALCGGIPHRTTKVLLTGKEAAAYLNIKPETLTKWRWAGKGPKAVKIGSAVRYRITDLEAFIEPIGGAA